MIDCHVTTEYGKLEAVILHRPGREIYGLSPENREELLFDDIPYLPAMQREHDGFAEALEASGTQVLYLTDLLEEVLREDRLREALVEDYAARAGAGGLLPFLKAHANPSALVQHLFAGIRRADVASSEEERVDWVSRSGSSSGSDYVLPPLPNLYFTRDPGAVIGSTIVSSRMQFAARDREALLVRCVLEHSPRIRHRGFSYGADITEDTPFTIEGGDITVLSSEAVVIGRSQRTHPSAIRSLATNLFRHSFRGRVYEVEIPNERSYMHLDTVFSVIDKDLVVIYPEALRQQTTTRVYTSVPREDGYRAAARELGMTFLDVLAEELPGFAAVLTGGGDPVAARREQWSDGTNLLAVAPRRVIAYDRNEETIRALKEFGVSVIAIPGSELVRGRGGPRCMSMPLRRSA